MDKQTFLATFTNQKHTALLLRDLNGKIKKSAGSIADLRILLYNSIGDIYGK